MKMKTKMKGENQSKKKSEVFSPTKKPDMKAKFLKVLEAKAGNVKEACKAINIGRSTHYDWLIKDSAYSQAVSDIQEGLIDFAESQLLKKIKEGHAACTIFFLKTKGQSRGYIEQYIIGGGKEIPQWNKESGEPLEYVLRKLSKESAR